jgi:hypothetical protein
VRGDKRDGTADEPAGAKRRARDPATVETVLVDERGRRLQVSNMTAEKKQHGAVDRLKLESGSRALHVMYGVPKS